MMATESGGRPSTILRATVLLPEPVPPAMPMTRGVTARNLARPPSTECPPLLTESPPLSPACPPLFAGCAPLLTGCAPRFAGCARRLAGCGPLVTGWQTTEERTPGPPGPPTDLMVDALDRALCLAWAGNPFQPANRGVIDSTDRDFIPPRRHADY